MLWLIGDVHCDSVKREGVSGGASNIDDPDAEIRIGEVDRCPGAAPCVRRRAEDVSAIDRGQWDGLGGCPGIAAAP